LAFARKQRHQGEPIETHGHGHTTETQIRAGYSAEQVHSAGHAGAEFKGNTMKKNEHADDYIFAEKTYQSLVRGDAVIGLVAEVGLVMKTMMQQLWRGAHKDHADSYALLGACYFAVLVPDGAFHGIYEEGQPDAWPADTLHIIDDNEALQAAMRCYFKAAELGSRSSAMTLAKIARHSTADNQRLALAALKRESDPTAKEVYQTGLVHHWLKEFEAAHACHVAAAARGDADATFELYIYYAQGLGCEPDAKTSSDWLNRSAEMGHSRALYNVGASWASGTSPNGEVDFDKAATFYERAEKAGNGRAAAMLGVMVLNGEIKGTKEQAIARLDAADELGFSTWELLGAARLEDPRG
jgi:TPR repeat protein